MRQKLQVLLTANAVVGLAFGVALLVAPAVLLKLYALRTDPSGLLLARLLGIELIGAGVVAWAAREADPYPADSAPRAVVRAHAVSESIGAVVGGLAAVQGLGNPLFWSVVAIYAVFAAAFLWAVLALRGAPGAEAQVLGA